MFAGGRARKREVDGHVGVVSAAFTHANTSLTEHIRPARTHTFMYVATIHTKRIGEDFGGLFGLFSTAPFLPSEHDSSHGHSGFHVQGPHSTTHQEPNKTKESSP